MTETLLTCAILAGFGAMLWRAREFLLAATIVTAVAFSVAFVGMHVWWTFWRIVVAVATGQDGGGCHWFSCP